MKTKAEIEADEQKPEALPVCPRGIPAELRERPQWVAWGYGRRRNRAAKWKWTKLPWSPTTGRLACSDDPATWGTFEQALIYCRQCRLDGISFAFTAGDPYCGIDLDDALAPVTGNLHPWAASILKTLDTYTEVSPSQTGVKLIGRGQVPPGGNRRGSVEMYDRGRFFTVTGARLPGCPATIRHIQGGLDQLHSELFAPKVRWPRLLSRPRPPSRRAAAPSQRERDGLSPDDARVVERASAAANGWRFLQLWRGDHTGFASASEADLALCNLLAFWIGPDTGRIDQLFRQSGRMRPKWDEIHHASGETYGERVTRMAVTSRNDFYGPYELHASILQRVLEWFVLEVRQQFLRFQHVEIYLARSVPSDFGKAYQLRTKDGRSYDLCLDQAGGQHYCSCGGAGCKHIRSLLAVAGELNRQPPPPILPYPVEQVEPEPASADDAPLF